VPDAARARGGAAPSALVVQRLCAAGREQGAELLRRARAARLAFHSGALPASFTVETASAGRAMQNARRSLTRAPTRCVAPASCEEALRMVVQRCYYSC